MAVVQTVEKLKVFISYSRADAKFADELVAGLEFDGGFNITIDRHSIEQGDDDWRARLRVLIEAADTIVFVLSPESAASKMCRWEVAYAAELEKRILPVLHLPLNGVEPPPGLSRPNYVDFTTAPTLIAGIRELANSLRKNFTWLREGTRLLNLALDWKRKGKRDNRLLTGPDLQEAKEWLAACPKTEQPTELHRDYIHASEVAEVARLDDERNRLAELAAAQAQAAAAAQRVAARTYGGLAMALVLAAAAGWFGWDASRKSEANRALTNTTQVAQSGLAALVAAPLVDDKLGKDSGSAALLALESLPDETSDDFILKTRKYDALSVFQLDRALRSLREIAVLEGDTLSLTQARWSPSGTKIVTASVGGSVIVWDTERWIPAVRLKGHRKNVFAVQWSPDGQRIATVSEDWTVRIWDVATGREIALLGNHTGLVTHAVWSQDGRLILTASGDRTARVWNAGTGDEIKRLDGHQGPVLEATWNQDASRVATVSGNTARIWDTATWTEVAKTVGNDGQIQKAAWNPDGLRLLLVSKGGSAAIWNYSTRQEQRLKGRAGHAVWDRDGTRILTSFNGDLRVWDAENGNELALSETIGKAIVASEWAPSGLHIASATEDLGAIIWDSSTGQLIASLDGHTAYVWDVSWGSDGKRVVTASHDGTARVWNIYDKKSVAQLGDQSGPTRLAQYSPDGQKIMTVSVDGTTRIWGAEDWLQISQFSIPCAGAIADVQGNCFNGLASWSPDSRFIATATSADKIAMIWDVSTAKQIVKLSGHGGDIINVRWNPKGDMLATSSFDLTARLWDATTGNQLARLDGHTGEVNSAVFSPDGTLIATASEDGTARIWDLNGRELARCEGHDGSVRLAKWSPEGKWILTASADKSARVWDAHTCKEVARLEGHWTGLNDAAWSPDGKLIVTGADDQTARIWDASTGKQLALLEGHAGRVHTAAWSADGKLIVTNVIPIRGMSGRSDHSITSARVWNALSGREVARLDAHDDMILSAEWSPIIAADGSTQIVTASADQSARVWRVYTTTQALVDAAKARVPRCLTLAQRQQYFLAAAPPTWCVERKLWPYQTTEWQAWLPLQRAWLASGRQGQAPPLPETE
jgi:WD40 repeat protein